MNEDFVPFELAKKLKEKGFNEPCFAYYTNNEPLYFNYSCKAGECYSSCLLSHNSMPKDSVSGKFADSPTISQVLKWLREKKGILIAIDVFKDYTSELVGWGYNIVLIDKYEVCHHCCNFDNYEQSAIAGIEYALDNIL